MSDEIRKKNNSTASKAIGIMAAITVIGLIYIWFILLYDEIENKNLPLLLTSPKMQYAVGDLVVLEVHNTGSYPLLFTNDAFEIRVSDSNDNLVWRAPYNETHTIIEPKQMKTVVWNTTQFDPDTYTVSTHVSTIDASITITLT